MTARTYGRRNGYGLSLGEHNPGEKVGEAFFLPYKSNCVSNAYVLRNVGLWEWLKEHIQGNHRM